MDSAARGENATFDSSNRFVSRLRSWLVTPVETLSDPRTIFWLFLSIALSVFMAYGPLRQAFSAAYVLQDDSRQHIFWLERFVDRDLFPNDFAVDYLQAIAPGGYKAFYQVAALLGIDPLLLSKLLPMGLGVLTTLICFVVSMRLLPVPGSAFISTMVLDQAIWAGDSIVSSTPRAFMYPLLLLFVYSLLCRSSILCLASIALLCLFYPPIVPIPVGVLCLKLVRLDSTRLRLSNERRDYVLCTSALAITFLLLLPYSQGISPFGPMVSAAEGVTMPEFLPGGRIEVFREGFVGYWLTGRHTGMFASLPLNTLVYGLFLLLALLWTRKTRSRLISRLSPEIGIFPRVILTSLVMFFMAHALLFRLYLPSRYTAHSFRISLALSAGICAVVILDTLFELAERMAEEKALLAPLAVCTAAVLIVVVVFYPAFNGSLSRQKYKIGKYASLYEFLSNQPKSAVIASLSREVDDLPVFAKRSILVGRQIALPYHKKYHNEMRQRAIDLISAQYCTDIADLQRFIRHYDISFLLVDKRAFTPEYLAGDKWFLQFQPEASNALARLRNSELPVLKGLLDRFTVLGIEDLVLLDARQLAGSTIGTSTTE